MIAIIDYDEISSLKLQAFLKGIGLNSVTTIKEHEILNASHIILPSTADLEKSLKMMYFYNLFYLLKVTNKPVLGINGGMTLMAESIGNPDKTGLGIFKNVAEKVQIKSVLRQDLKIDPLGSEYFAGAEFTDYSFRFETDFFFPVNKCTTAVADTGGFQFSVLMEKDNFTGVQFEIEASGSNGANFIKNYYLK